MRMVGKRVCFTKSEKGSEAVFFDEWRHLCPSSLQHPDGGSAHGCLWRWEHSGGTYMVKLHFLQVHLSAFLGNQCLVARQERTGLVG